MARPVSSNNPLITEVLLDVIVEVSTCATCKRDLKQNDELNHSSSPYTGRVRNGRGDRIPFAVGCTLDP
jgi:hypothetical protein